MSLARGILASVQAWYEVTYNVQPASPATELLYYQTFKPSPTIEQIVDPTMSGGFRGQLAPIQGKTDIGGQILTTVAPQSCAKYLANLIGTPVITTIGTAKQFVFNTAGGLPVGFGMELNYGTAIATPGRFIRMNGCRIGKGTLSAKASGFPTFTYDVKGSSLLWTPVATIQAAPTDYGHAGFSMFNAALTEGGGAIATVQTFDLTIDNDLDDSLFTITAGGIRGDLPEGMAKYSGTITALFKDMSLLNKALANTSTSLSLTWANGVADGTAGNESLNITVPNLAYKLVGPTIDGPKGIIQTLAFVGFRTGAAEQAASATLKAMRTLA